MANQNNDQGQTAAAADGGAPSASASTPPSAPTVEEVTADRDRWRALSRQNEDNFNQTRTELQQLQAAQEAALEAARAEGRTSALGEASTELVTASLQLQALQAGAQLPDLSYLDLNRFAGDDKRPDSEAVTAFIESLPKQSSDSAFPPLAGAGHNRGGGSGEITSMDPVELADLISGGTFL